MIIQLLPDERRAILGLTAQSSDEEIVSVLKTISQKSPEDPEIAASLSQVLAHSGSQLEPSSDFVADVASTGGPSSLSTLICPLFLRAAGAVVPKLGVPGRPAGGIDCLAQIPGYRTILSLHEVSEILCSGGYAHFLATGAIAPLDGRMFRLRQIHGAQAVPTLVTASLLAKKLAVGVVYAGLDIRVARYGNFGGDWVTASCNARLFVQASQSLGVKATPTLTDGRFPYQPYIGRREALLGLEQIFSGKSSQWLDWHLHTCRLLAQACVPRDKQATISGINAKQLRACFDQNLKDQGAETTEFERVVEETKRLHTHTVVAAKAGFVHYPLENIRDLMLEWQNLGFDTDSSFPDPVGIILLRRPGEWVAPGEGIATFRAPQELNATVAEALGQCISTPLEFPVAPGIEGIIRE